MHPAALSYQVLQVRITDLHRQAQRDALVQAARHRRPPRSHPAHRSLARTRPAEER